MDHALTREESQRLMELLNLPMEQFGNFHLMKRAFLSSIKKYHPDKGGDESMAKELISLYKKAECHVSSLETEDDTSFTTDEVPPYGTPEWEAWWNNFNDLFCREQFDRSESEEEEEEEEEPPPSCSSQKSSQKRDREEEEPESSQSTPPKKKKPNNPTEMPEDLLPFLSQAILSNKTVSGFCIFTTLEKSLLLYHKLTDKYKPTFISRHKDNRNNNHGYVYLITPTRHRVSAINNYCVQLCTVSFVICKGIIKDYSLFVHLSVEPYVLLNESIPGGLTREFFDSPEEAQKNVSWKMISEFALQINCDDVFLLMGLYKEFALETETCSKCKDKINPDHFQFHKEHQDNAKLFDDCRNQKTICQQAVDNVIAARRVETTQLSRKQLLTKRFEFLFKKMENLFAARSSVNIKLYMAGAAWFDSLLPGIDLKEFILEFLESMVDNIPKKRFWLFTGPVNTGKTTLAACLLDLCGGKSLNINMPFEKLNFELGVAIDQFMIVFEDVKGQSEHKHLPTGQGISNLDNLRDFLDGAVKVNLEKKHLNKRSMIFPPGIITANEYTFPLTLRARLNKTIRFVFQKNMFASLKKTPGLLKYRVLQSGVCLLLFLVFTCDIEDFAPDLREKVKLWKSRIEEEVTELTFLDFRTNCSKGDCILKGHCSQSQNTQETADMETQDFCS
ncbi:large T antigen [Bat polyomavirus 6c]|uniref:DNA 3'-5' helicase n=1 Tax=Bat polyomavirus 6c TaxID=1623688 RepID=A0A0D5ZZ40_9POLY|nr:large T antigen [Bat polyomavirus 6c]BAQ55572.1 large T antigen [Bat polyomavirus 6c]